MAEFEITIQTGEGGTETPQTIKNKLESLTGSSRLLATAIQGINPGGYVDINDIVSDLEDLEGDDKLSFNALKDVPSLSGHPDAAAHRDMLQTLTGANRLSGASVILTGNAAALEMVTGLQGLADANRLSLITGIKDSTRVKTAIAGTEKAFNLRGFGHVIGSQAYRDTYMTNCRIGDVWIQSDPSTVYSPDGDGFPGPPPVGGGTLSPLCVNGDWFVCLSYQAGPPTQPTFWYTELWLRIPLGQLYSTFNWPAWGGVAGDGSATGDELSGTPVGLIVKTEQSGASFYGSSSEAMGKASLALGIQNKTDAGAALSIATGKGSGTTNFAEQANAATLMNTPGDIQYSTFPMYGTTGDNSPRILTTPQNPKIQPVSSNIIEIEGTATSEDAAITAYLRLKYLVSIDNDLTVTATSVDVTVIPSGTGADDINITIAPEVTLEGGWPIGRMNITAVGLPFVTIVWNLKVTHQQTVFPLNNT